MDLGPHAAFVWSAYAIMTAVLSGLVVWLVIEGRRQQRLLDSYEARGVRRRSERAAQSANRASD
jgi:heme exporter protein D